VAREKFIAQTHAFAVWISDIRIIVGLVIAVVTGIYSISALSVRTFAEIADHEKRLENLENANTALNAQVNALQSKLDELTLNLSRGSNIGPKQENPSGVGGGNKNDRSVCPPGQYVVGVTSSGAPSTGSLFNVAVFCQPLNLGAQ
jgi:hypothetical protein